MMCNCGYSISTMKKVKLSLDQIQAQAYDLSQEKRGWHFHILTKDCLLNQSGEHVFLLESHDNEEVFVHYCSEKPVEVGKKLAKLLHGEDIVRDNPLKESIEMPDAVAEIINRAKALNTACIAWHHHLLFPGCVFNRHAGKWTLIFEDPENRQILENVSDAEPRFELQEIETLFYEQRV